MDWFSPRRDGFILLVLALLLVMLAAGLAGAYRAFGYAFVALAGLFTGLGFTRRGRPVTLVPPVLATAALAIGMTGMFLNETVIVRTVADTRLGFHPGTAFLVYAVWIPPLFTLAVSFALLFREVTGSSISDEAGSAPTRKEEAR
jgi:hypothetical protein